MQETIYEIPEDIISFDNSKIKYGYNVEKINLDLNIPEVKNILDSLKLKICQNFQFLKNSNVFMQLNFNSLHSYTIDFKIYNDNCIGCITKSDVDYYSETFHHNVGSISIRRQNNTDFIDISSQQTFINHDTSNYLDFIDIQKNMYDFFSHFNILLNEDSQELNFIITNLISSVNKIKILRDQHVKKQSLKPRNKKVSKADLKKTANARALHIKQNIADTLSKFTEYSFYPDKTKLLKQLNNLNIDEQSPISQFEIEIDDKSRNFIFIKNANNHISENTIFTSHNIADEFLNIELNKKFTLYSFTNSINPNISNNKLINDATSGIFDSFN
jgi:hypothetical protein